MLNWGNFRRVQPAMAVAGQDLLYHFGVGLAFLATTRKDRAPRLHPICIILSYGCLYGLIIPSPKLNDLRRDGRYALHSYPLPENEDAFYLTGRAVVIGDTAIRTEVESTFMQERPSLDLVDLKLHEQTLVEFLIETALLTRTTGHGDPAPRHTVWTAASEG